MSLSSHRQRTVDASATIATCGVAALVAGVAFFPERIPVGLLSMDATTALVPIAIVALVPFVRRRIWERLGQTGLLVVVLAFLALQLVSICASGFGMDTYATFLRYAGYAFLLALTTIAASDRRLRRSCMWLVLAAGALVSANGIVWYVNRIIDGRITLGAQWTELHNIRVISTFQNANFLGEYLLLVIGVGSALALSSRGWRKTCAWICTALAGVALAATYTRGSWLALAVSFGVVLVVMNPRYFWGALTAGVAAGLGVPGVAARLLSSFSTEGSAGFRLSLWRVAGQAIADKPLFGWGPGRFYDAFNATVAAHPELGVGYASYGAHNSYFTLTAETGVFGGLAFLVLIASIVRLGSSAMSRASEHALAVQAAAMTAGLGGFALNALTSNSFQHPQAAMFFWLVAGLLAGLSLEVEVAAGVMPVREEREPGRWAEGSGVVRAIAPLRRAFVTAWSVSASRSVLLGAPRTWEGLVEGSLSARLFFGRPGSREGEVS